MKIEVLDETREGQGPIEKGQTRKILEQAKGNPGKIIRITMDNVDELRKIVHRVRCASGAFLGPDWILHTSHRASNPTVADLWVNQRVPR